jgi:hypothetical protein
VAEVLNIHKNPKNIKEKKIKVELISFHVRTSKKTFEGSHFHENVTIFFMICR